MSGGAADALVVHGNLLHRLGSLEAALDHYDRALALDAAHVEGWRARGITLDALDQPAAACRSLRRALALDPDDLVAWTNLAFIEGRRSARRGVRLWREVLRRAPGDRAAWLNLAFLLHTLGSEAEALEAEARAAALAVASPP